MNRKDVIVIAVLINAGLLVVLFTSALKSDHSEPAMVMETQLPSTTPQAHPSPSLQVKGDEVDQMLSQFAAVATPVQEPTVRSQAPLISGINASSEVNLLPDVHHLEAAEAKSALSTKEVVVKKGDVLEKIARANRTSVQEIMRLNKLSSTQLKIGQILKIPSKGAHQLTAAEDRVYTVKNGDNPWTIAVKNHMKLEELLQLNNLDEERARKLKPGDQLKIR